MSYRTLKGMRDLLPQDTEAWQAMEAEVSNLAKVYGFSEIRTPILETASLFSRAAGELTDIVQKEQYSFEDKGGDQVSLRPEGTAPVVRALLEHKLLNENPIQKLYYIAPMFRRERPQKGRYRQHFQLGVESYGGDHPFVDVEILSLLYVICKNLGVPGPKLNINSLGDEDCRPEYRKALQAYLKKHLSSLDETSRGRVDENPMRVFDSKVPSTQEVLREAPVILDYLNDDCQKRFEQVQEGLAAINVPFEVNPRIVRGLDYYSHTAFELIAEGLGSQNTVGGGGRYNGLVKQLGGPPTPAIGFGLGLDRLMMIAENLTVPKKTSGMIYGLNREANTLVLRLGSELREKWTQAKETSQLHLGFDGKNLKSVLKKADKAQMTWVAVIGDEELKNKNVLVKYLSTGEQKFIDQEVFVREFSKNGAWN